MGVANPPGFPLYYLMGRLFTLLPIGDAAFRINVMSAFFGALAVMMVARGIEVFLQILHSRNKSDERASARVESIPMHWIAVFSALFLSVTPVFWSQSLIAEEYALNAFLLSLLIFLSLRAIHLQRENIFYLTSFVMGLSFSNHPLTLVFIPSFLFIIAIMVKKDCSLFRQSAFSLVVMVVGLSSYLYIPIRAASATPVLWNPIEGLESLYHYFTAQSQHGEIFSSTLLGYVYKLFMAFDILLEQLTIPGCLVVALGIWISVRRDWRPSLLLLLVAFADITVSSYVKFNRHTVSVYLIPSLIVFTYLGASGLLVLWNISRRKVSWWIQAGVMAALLVLVCASNWRWANREGLYLDLSLGQDILQSLPSDSTFFTEGDNATFSLLYLKTVERARADVRIVAPESTLFGSWMEDEAGPIFAFSKGKKGQEGKPQGIIYSLGSTSTNLDSGGLFDRYRLKYEIGGHLPEDEKVRFVAALYPERLGRFLLRAGSPKEEGLVALQKASSIGGRISEVVHNNVGQAYREGGYYREAEEEFRMSFRINPLYPFAYLNLASMLMDLGRDEEALHLFEKALKWTRGGVGLYTNLGALYMKKNQDKKALRIFQRGLVVYPRANGIHYNLGIIYSQTGKWALAEKAFKKALQIRPNFSLARKKLAGLLIRLERYQEAEEQYREVLKLEPKAIDVINDMGRLAIGKKELDQALKLFERSLSINPNQPDVRLLVEKLHGELLMKEGR